MKTILHYISILLLAFLTVDNVSGQTVIDYTAWTPNTNCNLFGTGPIINGLEHRTVLGKPTYETVNKSIVLESDKDINNVTRGTSFRINYNFKKGYTYKITIKAWRFKGTSTSSNIRLRSELVNSSTTTAQCGGPEFNNNFGGTTTTSQYNDIDVTTDKDFIYNFNSLQSNFSHLIVGALIDINSTIQLAYIKKITILETAPELILIPATLATTCGISTTHTFTVTNPSGLEDITSYEWNLGSANNGWLYNGSPAPQYISTTASSLSLTSIDNATTVNNVGVTIKINNVSFKSYSTTVTRSTIVPTITGLSQFCVAENYYVPILPAGATVSWSIYPSYGVADLTTSGNTATLTKIGDGNVELTATVSSPSCGTSTTFPKSVQVGAASFPYYNTSPAIICDQTPFYFFPALLPDGVSIISVQGQINATYQNLQQSFGGYLVPVGVYVIKMELSSNCGPSTVYQFFFRGICNGSGYRMVYPNPANTELTIDYTEDDKTEPINGSNLAPTIILFNEKGEKVPLKIIREEEFKKTFDTRDLSDGTYYLHITEGKETVKKQVIIKH